MNYLLRKIVNKLYSFFIRIEKQLLLNHYLIANKSVVIDRTFQFERYFDLRVQNEYASFVIGKDVIIKNYCSFVVSKNGKLIVSDGVFMNKFCSINCMGEVYIGSNTLLGEGVRMYDHNHKYESKDELIKDQGYSIGSIRIGNNCWIGSNTIILNNVEIGDNVIIGANNLIYKSIPANQIVTAKHEFLQKEY